MSVETPGRQDAVQWLPDDTRGAALRRLRQVFTAAGLERAETDARFLLRGVLGCDGAALISRPDAPLGPQAATALTEGARRRLEHEPVSRILGQSDFYGRAFFVTADVLDPRPETETLIDVILKIVRDTGWVEKSIHIADIGTGSGAIIVTALAELPRARGTATDISAPALDVARRNAAQYGLDHRIGFLHGNLLHDERGPFDIIVSNPPYIPTGEIADLVADVRNFDPHLALDGGPDGLMVYRAISRTINELGGSLWVVLEVGLGQAESVEAIFRAEFAPGRIAAVRTVKDLGGHIRCVTLQIQS